MNWSNDDIEAAIIIDNQVKNTIWALFVIETIIKHNNYLYLLNKYFILQLFIYNCKSNCNSISPIRFDNTIFYLFTIIIRL